MHPSAHSACAHAPRPILGAPRPPYKCFLDRCTERGVVIELEDLRPCPVNLFHQPHSWFDHYERDASPEAVQTWLDEYDRALDFYCPDQFKLPINEHCRDFNRSLIRLHTYNPQLKLPFDEDSHSFNRAMIGLRS